MGGRRLLAIRRRRRLEAEGKPAGTPHPRRETAPPARPAVAAAAPVAAPSPSSSPAPAAAAVNGKPIGGGVFGSKPVVMGGRLGDGRTFA
jgi:hypothetical protein